jgi:putative membrane protein
MIKYNPKSWFKLIFALHKSDTMRILWKELIYIAVLSGIIAWIEITYFPSIKALANLNIVYSLVGFVISLLLVFRTNTAYDRWWEGRKKWGELVNDSRNFAVKLSSMNLQQEDNIFFSRMIANFAIASKDHLKQIAIIENLDLTAEEIKRMQDSEHVPVEIVQMMYERLSQLKQTGVLQREDYIVLDSNLNGFLNMIGACERIRNTPIPFSYSLFIKKFIFIYTGTLPIAFVSLLGYYSVIVTVLVFYVLVSMEILAEEIEDPFGLDDNDLPTDEISERIKALSMKILK